MNISLISYYELLGSEEVSSNLLERLANDDNAEENTDPVEEEKEYLAIAPCIDLQKAYNTSQIHFHYSDKLIVFHPEIAELPPWQA